MSNSTESEKHSSDKPALAADALRIRYALEVKAADQVVLDIHGSADLHHALHPDLRRNTAANFHRLMGLLLLEPALIQLNAFVNDRRRADIAARDAATEAGSEPASTSPATESLDTSPDLTPEAPLKVITA
ncbi:MAG: hypothetical protein FD161_1242 [Limisphaerales bacterium]|nr:MAG: hypothetical protein FD161_1242 [Limisphaerales bacterium]TXT49514.1 MAG: hypothetical protein FD140_3046 [Limisphaerales bacterium]